MSPDIVIRIILMLFWICVYFYIAKGGSKNERITGRHRRAARILDVLRADKITGGLLPSLKIYGNFFKCNRAVFYKKSGI